jgi:hypothetical protein
MQFPYRIDPARRLAIVTVSGAVHGRDISTTMTALFADRGWAPGHRILWDSRGITELLFQERDLPEFLAVQKAHDTVAPAREVIVVTRELDKAMATAYANLVRSLHQVHVCRSMDDAMGLLDH